MNKIILFSALLLSMTGWSQTDTAIVKFVNPPAVSTPNGYSHTAVIDLGNCKMILIAGQVALDREGNLVGKGDFSKQTEQVFLNLQSIIEDAGGKIENIVKLGIYLTDVSKIQIVRDIRNKFIDIKNPPASTLVQVSKLFREELLIEIEATAIISKK